MLIVVEYRNADVLQAVFDFEAAGGADVFQIDAAESRGHSFDDADDFIDALGGETQGHRIDAAEFLEQLTLSLHDRHGRFRADVAEAEDGGAVADYRHGVATNGQGVRQILRSTDGQTHPGNAGSVGAGKIDLGNQRALALNLQLAAPVEGKGVIRHRYHGHAGQTGGESGDDRTLVIVVAGVDGDFAHDLLPGFGNHPNFADVAAQFTDEGRQPSEGTRNVGQPESNGRTEGRRGGDQGHGGRHGGGL